MTAGRWFWKDRLSQWIASRLPQRLRYWVWVEEGTTVEKRRVQFHNPRDYS